MKRCILFLIFIIAVVSCDDFLNKDTEAAIKKFEEGQYITITDIEAGNRVLKKGTKIKLKTRFDKKWVKIYGYKADVDELVANQVLIIYLFQDDFEKKKFNFEEFETRLYAKIKKLQ